MISILPLTTRIAVVSCFSLAMGASTHEEIRIESDKTPSSGDDRRGFLKKCGTFAAVTPPAVTMLLSTSLTSNAIAKSNGNNGWGNSGHDGTNKGSSKGGGVLGGGQGNGQSQGTTKKADGSR